MSAKVFLLFKDGGHRRVDDPRVDFLQLPRFDDLHRGLWPKGGDTFLVHRFHAFHFKDPFSQFVAYLEDGLKPRDNEGRLEALRALERAIDPFFNQLGGCPFCVYRFSEAKHEETCYGVRAIDGRLP